MWEFKCKLLLASKRKIENLLVDKSEIENWRNEKNRKNQKCF